MGGLLITIPLLYLEMTRMKKMITWVCLFSFLACVVGSAAAQEKKPVDKKAAFGKMDTDKDGKLTLEEFKAGKKGKALENADKAFARIDKNSDKSISLEEFTAPPKKKTE
jgi:Ca2+-binding EF-hand superfamily protein